MKGIRHENKICRSSKLCNVVSVTAINSQLVTPLSTSRCLATSNNVGSMSIAETCRATFAI